MAGEEQKFEDIASEMRSETAQGVGRLEAEAQLHPKEKTEFSRATEAGKQLEAMAQALGTIKAKVDAYREKSPGEAKKLEQALAVKIGGALEKLRNNLQQGMSSSGITEALTGAHDEVVAVAGIVDKGPPPPTIGQKLLDNIPFVDTQREKDFQAMLNKLRAVHAEIAAITQAEAAQEQGQVLVVNANNPNPLGIPFGGMTNYTSRAQ